MSYDVIGETVAMYGQQGSYHARFCASKTPGDFCMELWMWLGHRK